MPTESALCRQNQLCADKSASNFFAATTVAANLHVREATYAVKTPSQLCSAYISHCNTRSRFVAANVIIPPLQKVYSDFAQLCNSKVFAAECAFADEKKKKKTRILQQHTRTLQRQNACSGNSTTAIPTANDRPLLDHGCSRQGKRLQLLQASCQWSVTGPAASATSHLVSHWVTHKVRR